MSSLLPTLAVVAQSIFIVLVGLLVFRKESLLRVIAPYMMWGAFLIVLGSIAGSVWYSDVLGYEPCSLCWYQRIFLFPQLLILGVGLFKGDSRSMAYSFWLSCVGGLIAFYHSLLQYGFETGLPCPVGGSVSCAQRFVFEFGYITIPVMALTTFALLIVFTMIHKKYAS